MAHEAAHSSSARTKWPVAALFGLVGGIVIAVLVMAFVWPAATSQREEPACRHQWAGGAGRGSRGRAGRAGSRAVRPGRRGFARRRGLADQVPRAVRRDPPRRDPRCWWRPQPGRRRRRRCAALRRSCRRRSARRRRRPLSHSCSSSEPRSPRVSRPHLRHRRCGAGDPAGDGDGRRAAGRVRSDRRRPRRSGFPLTIGGMLGGILLSLLVAGRSGA